MRLLIIHDDSPLLEKLCHLIQQRVELIDYTPLSLSTPLVKLQEGIAQHSTDQVLFLARLLPTSTDIEKHDFTAKSQAIIHACEAINLPLLFISSAAVFSPSTITLEETAPTEPTTELGKIYEALEQQCLRHPKAIILRTGWIFSGSGTNFLTQGLDAALQGKKIAFNSAGKGCPTHASDLARVILGMCLQIPFMPSLKDIYHYVSSDASIGFQFLETLLTAAANFDQQIDPKNILFEHQVIENSPFFFEPVMLSCQRLLYDFGIHQRPWRSSINQAVKIYFSE
ncbi:MAG: sugar nucleotide-binding protein [Cellvibrionales bacterium]|nr:sugar nucleotide-binding protein [Cellvibrionales bacterium]